MTKAVFWETEREIGMQVSGHAGYDGGGRDIVCAACSVLVQAAGNALYRMGCDVRWEQTDGMYRLAVKKEPKALAALAVPREGFEMLSEAYGQYVTVIDGEA